MALDPAEPDRTSPDLRPDPSTAPPFFPVPAVTASLTGDDSVLPGGTYDTGTTVASDSIFPPSPINVTTQLGGGGLPADLLEDDREALRNKIMVEGAAMREQDRLDRNYTRRQEEAFRAEMATANELHPWDAQREMASRKHDLWEQFGSPGFLIAMMASAFTTMPMVSALNGGAAAMNAINQGDVDAYDQAFQAYKNNTDLVLKRMDIEQKAFQNISELRTSNFQEFREKMLQNAQMYNDTRTMNLLNYGFDKEAIEAQEGLAQLQEKLASAHKALQESNAWSMVVTSNPDWPYDFGGNLKPEYASGKKRVDPQKMNSIIVSANMALAKEPPTTAEGLGLWTMMKTPGFFDQDPDVMRKMVTDYVAGLAAARSTGKGGLANAEVRQRWDAWDTSNPQKPDESDEAYQARKSQAHDRLYAEWLKNAQRSRMSTKEAEMRDRIDKWDADHQDATDEDKNAAHDKIMADVAKATAKSQNDATLKLRFNPQWLVSPDGQKFIASQDPETQKMYRDFLATGGVVPVDPARLGWTPEAITGQAEIFNQTGVEPHYLGARQYGPLIMGAIKSRAMELMREKYPGLTDEQLATKRTQQWQDYRTQQVALNRFRSGPQWKTINSLNVVVQHLQVLKALTEAQDRSDWITFNKISNWWAEEFGKEAPTDAKTAAIIVGNEVIKSIQGGQLGTQEERNDAAKFYANYRSEEQTTGAIGIATKLLVGQLRALKYGFTVATGREEKEFTNMLLPETLQYFSKAEIDAMEALKDVSGYSDIPSRPGGKAPVIELDPIKK